jgi:hypothetical protein
MGILDAQDTTHMLQQNTDPGVLELTQQDEGGNFLERAEEEIEAAVHFDMNRPVLVTIATDGPRKAISDRQLTPLLLQAVREGHGTRLQHPDKDTAAFVLPGDVVVKIIQTGLKSFKVARQVQQFVESITVWWTYPHIELIGNHFGLEVRELKMVS